MKDFIFENFNTSYFILKIHSKYQYVPKNAYKMDGPNIRSKTFLTKLFSYIYAYLYKSFATLL
jgi:hypothetical protein